MFGVGGGVKFNSQGPWLSTDPRKWMTNLPSQWAVFPRVIFFQGIFWGVYGLEIKKKFTVFVVYTL